MFMKGVGASALVGTAATTHKNLTKALNNIEKTIAAI
jgi:hypothetical protein